MAERFIEGDEPIQTFIGQGDTLIERDSLPSTSAFRGTTRSRMIYEHMPHGLGNHAIELSPILPSIAGLTHQPQKRLVNQRRSL